MKTSYQSISARIASSRAGTLGEPHSALFDEVAVVLPDAIEQPTLKKLATKVQQLQTSANKQVVVNKAAVNKNTDSSNSLQDNTKAQSMQASDEKADGSDDAIRRAHAILQDLYSTPNAHAAVLVAITNEPQPKLLLTRRASHLKSHASEVSFAGGKHELGDGNNVVTALREAMEETALPPSKVHIIGQLPVQTSKFDLSVRPIVALIDPDVTFVPELGEIARIFWADFETLISQPTVDYECVYTSKTNKDEPDSQCIKYLTPSWVVDKERVWGLTGRIIANLLEVGFGRKIQWYYRLKD